MANSGFAKGPCTPSFRAVELGGGVGAVLKWAVRCGLNPNSISRLSPVGFFLAVLGHDSSYCWGPGGLLGLLSH